MKIYKSLKLKNDKKYLISFVGGGGKTSTIFCLAKELKNKNKKVLITTSTKIYPPENHQYDHLFVDNDINKTLEQLKLISDSNIAVIAADYLQEPEKLQGYEPEIIDRVFDNAQFDYILVEADGAKRKPIKTPDTHEPVIPLKTNILIGLIGIDCFMKPISNQWVHRPELFAKLVESELNENIDEEIITKFVNSKNGLFKSHPDKCELIFMINKVNSGKQLKISIQISRNVLKGENKPDKIIIADVFEKNPVKKIFILKEKFK